MSEAVWKSMIQTTLRLQHDVEQCRINDKATHTLIKMKTMDPLKAIPNLPICKVWEVQLLEKLVTDNSVSIQQIKLASYWNGNHFLKLLNKSIYF